MKEMLLNEKMKKGIDFHDFCDYNLIIERH